MIRIATIVFGLASIALTPYGYSQQTNMAQNVEVKISVYNDAHVDEKVVEEGVALATWIYRKAGVQTIWLDCSSVHVSNIIDPRCREAFGPSHPTIRIVARAASLKYDTFGAAFLSSDGIGVYSDVFYDRILRFTQQDRKVSPSCVLGHVLAHEIGHLLLGVNAHSVAGIMRAGWRDRELGQAEMGTLLFLPEQGNSMRARLRSLNSSESTARIMTRQVDSDFGRFFERRSWPFP